MNKKLTRLLERFESEWQGCAEEEGEGRAAAGVNASGEDAAQRWRTQTRWKRQIFRFGKCECAHARAMEATLPYPTLNLFYLAKP